MGHPACRENPYKAGFPIHGFVLPPKKHPARDRHLRGVAFCAPPPAAMAHPSLELAAEFENLREKGATSRKRGRLRGAAGRIESGCSRLHGR